MRGLLVSSCILLCPFVAYGALTTGSTGLVSSEIKIPTNVQVDPSYLAPIDSTKAAGLNVAGASGGPTNPACVAETQARAARKQPPPMGDFGCTPIAASNGSGFVSGVCFANVCQGTSFSLLGSITSFLGSSAASLSSIASGILSAVAGGGQSSSPSGAGDIGIPVPQTPPTSELIVTDSTQPIDTSFLYAQSVVIVDDLRSALNPPGTQVSI